MTHWTEWLQHTRHVVREIQTERQEFARKHHEALIRQEPLGEDLEEALWRFRGLSVRAMEKGVFAYNDLDRFLQFSIVNTHDAAADALACIYSGAGAPSAALLRRLYELTNLLAAAWLKPRELRSAMEDALARPYTDDRYALLAGAGAVGAVMPSPNKVRELAFGDSPEIREFEGVLKSFAHGGFASYAFYLSPEQQADHLDHTIESSRNLARVAKNSTVMASAAAAQIAARLGFEMTYPHAYSVFTPEIVEAREDEAMRVFDECFPHAVDMIWSACVGIGSVTSELSEHIGSREHDPIRRQQLVLVDGLESAWLATELLFRGRLVASGTVTRRLFELSLEAQAWAQKPRMMTDRFNEPTGRFTSPSATHLIRLLHGPKDTKSQRRTYSTLCSIAHGGAQAVDFLLDGDWPRLRIQPAPAFMRRHHVWLLGTLISGVDALLGASLVVGGRVDPEIARNHGGYLTRFREAINTIPGLYLIRHEEAEPENDFDRS